MSDWFTTAVAMQREIIRAHQSQVDAAKSMLDASSQIVDLQEAGQKAVQANMTAWKSWAKLWGMGGK